MIRLAFSTNAFKKNTLTEAVDAIAAAGYTGVEIMADVPHAHPATFTADRRAALHEQLQRCKLTVSNINAFTLFADGDTYHPTWIEDDPALRQKRIDHTILSVALADELGAKTISLQPGGPLIGSGISRQTAGRRFADGLQAVLPAARQRNIILVIEPEPGLFIESAAEYLEFKQTFFADEPLVKMNCDIGHLYCVGDNPARVILQMPEQIAHVHVEDIGANRVHQHLALGKGAMDFATIFAALDRINYAGWVTVELYPYEASAAEVAMRAMEYLRGLLG